MPQHVQLENNDQSRASPPGFFCYKPWGKCSHLCTSWCLTHSWRSYAMQVLWTSQLWKNKTWHFGPKPVQPLTVRGAAADLCQVPSHLSSSCSRLKKKKHSVEPVQNYKITQSILKIAYADFLIVEGRISKWILNIVFSFYLFFWSNSINMMQTGHAA